MGARLGLVLLCGAGLVACGGDASGGSEGADATTGSLDESGDETGDEPPVPGEPPWGEPIDPCVGVTCSGHGTCVATGLVASCECEPGFVGKRHECIACTPLGAERVYDVDVPRVTVQPLLTFNGGQPPVDGAAHIELVSDDGFVRVMRSDHAPTPLSVIPGVYELRFRRLQHPHEDDSLPENMEIVFATGRTITTDGELPIDVPVVTLTANVTVNGGPLAHATVYSSWSYSAVHRATEDTVSFDDVGDHTNVVELIPGIYDMIFDGGPVPTPDNRDAITGERMVIAKSGHIALDLPMVQQSGTLTVGGQVLDLPPLDGDNPAVAFSNPELGRAWIGDPSVGGDYSMRIIPGVYDIVYEQGEPRPGLPDNQHAMLPAGLTITTDGGATNVDIPIVTRSGALTLDGVPVAADEWGAELYYINRATGDRVLIRDLAWGEYEIELIPGVYDLLYELHEPRPILPSNDESLIAAGIVVEQSGSFDIDVPTITISGSVTVNGQLAGQPEQAYIYFMQPEIGGRVKAADVGAGSYSVKLIPGTYDVVYDLQTPHWEHPPGLPINKYVLLAKQVVLDESGTFDIDIPAVEVTGIVTIAGEPIPGGAIWLYNPGSDSSMRLTLSGEPYSALLVPGTYEVTYGRDSDDLMIPQNHRALLDCIILE